jgi:hypothetical protein
MQWMRSQRDGGASENKSLSDASNYGACGLYDAAEGPLSSPRPVPNKQLEQVIVSLLLSLLYLSDWLNYKKSGC